MVSKVLQINNEKTIFWTLLTVFLLAIGLYIYLINSTVRNVVATQNIEGQIAQLNLAISNKEFSYINKRNTVTLNLAYSLGFKEVSAKTYLPKQSTKEVSFLSR